MHLVRKRILGFGVALQDDPQQTVARDHIVDQFGALHRFNQQRSNHAGKNHDVGQAENWQRLWKRSRGDAGGSFGTSRRSQNTNKLCIGRGHIATFSI